MAEQLPKNVDFLSKESDVPDHELAASLLDEVIGFRGVREPIKSMLERAYAELRKRNSAWTRRRLKAVFYKEANRIDYREIEEMRAVIQARKEHADFKAETTRRVALALGREADRNRQMAPE